MTNTSWLSWLSEGFIWITQRNKKLFSGDTVIHMLQFGRKPQPSSFSSLNLHLLTNRRRCSSHLLPTVRGWLRLYWWWSSGEDATRRDATRYDIRRSWVGIIIYATRRLMWVCVWGGGSRCHCLESRVSGERKSTNLTWWQFQSRLLTPPPAPFPLTAPDNQPVLLIRPWIAWHWHRILRRGASLPFLPSKPLAHLCTSETFTYRTGSVFCVPSSC